MVLVYIDESGSSSLKDKEKLFVLTAILVKEENYKDIDISVANFREEISYTYNIPYNFEIHISALLDYNKSNDFKDLSYQERMEILEKIYLPLEKLNFKIISVVLLKDEWEPREESEEEEQMKIRFWVNLSLLERIQMFTKDLGNNSYAIIFRDDENDKWNQRKLDILKSAIYYHEYNPSYIKITNIIPTIYFLESHKCMGIQIADAVGFSVRRKLRYTIYENEGEVDKINNKSFELIKNKFHKYPDCLQKGLKFFQKKCLDKYKDRVRRILL